MTAQEKRHRVPGCRCYHIAAHLWDAEDCDIHRYDPTEPTRPAEVLARAASFDPTPAEEFIAWAKAVDPDRPPACPCPGCAVVAKEVKAAKIMRLALEMIVARRVSDNCMFCNIAERALKECGS